MDIPPDTAISFVYPPSQSLLCPICHEVFKDPVITQNCNHSFCHACILQCLDVDAHCPLCRSRLKAEELHSNLALSTLVSEILVYCIYKSLGCTDPLRLESLPFHIKCCPFAPSVCVYNKYGCTFEGTQRQLLDHLRECVFEKLKGYIESTSKTIQDLKSLVDSQGKDVVELKTKVSKLQAKYVKLKTRIRRRTIQQQHHQQEVLNGEEIDSLSEDSETEQLGTCVSKSLSLSAKKSPPPEPDTFPYGDIQCRKTIADHRTGVTSLAYHNDIIFSGAYDGSCRLYDSKSGELIKKWNGHQMSVWALAVLPWDHIGHSDQRLDRENEEEVLEDGQGEIIIPREHWKLFSAGSDATIKQWDVPIYDRRGIAPPPMTITSSSSSSGSSSSSSTTHPPALIAPTPRYAVPPVPTTPTRTTLLSSVFGTDPQASPAKSFTTTTSSTTTSPNNSPPPSPSLPETPLQSTKHTGKIYSLLLHPTNPQDPSTTTLISASSDKTIKLWNPDTLTPLTQLLGHTSGINSILPSPTNSHHLFSASSDKSVKIWDLKTQTCLTTLSTDYFDSEILDIAIIQNLLFASTYDAKIQVIELNSFRKVKELLGHSWEIWQLEAVSRGYNEPVLFSASFDHTIKRWDVRNLVESATLRGHKGYVHALTSGDGCLLSGCADKTIKIWK